MEVLRQMWYLLFNKLKFVCIQDQPIEIIIRRHFWISPFVTHDIILMQTLYKYFL